jgi:hypothetical protein
MGASNVFDDFVIFKTPEFYFTGINKLVSYQEKYMKNNGFYFD